MLTFNHGSPYFCHKVVLPKFISGCRMDLICSTSRPKRIYNPITAFWQCLPFSWTTIRGKHCWHPIAIMGVVDTFKQCFISEKVTGGGKSAILPNCCCLLVKQCSLPPRVKYLYIAYPYNFQTKISISNHCV